MSRVSRESRVVGRSVMGCLCKRSRIAGSAASDWDKCLMIGHDSRALSSA